MGFDDDSVDVTVFGFFIAWALSTVEFLVVVTLVEWADTAAVEINFLFTVTPVDFGVEFESEPITVDTEAQVGVFVTENTGTSGSVTEADVFVTVEVDGLFTETDVFVTEADGLVTEVDGLPTETDVFVTEVDGVFVTEVDGLFTETDVFVTEVDGLVTEVDVLVTEADGLVIKVDAFVTEVDAFATEFVTEVNVSVTGVDEFVTAFNANCDIAVILGTNSDTEDTSIKEIILDVVVIVVVFSMDTGQLTVEDETDNSEFCVTPKIVLIEGITSGEEIKLVETLVLKDIGEAEKLWYEVKLNDSGTEEGKEVNMNGRWIELGTVLERNKLGAADFWEMVGVRDEDLSVTAGNLNSWSLPQSFISTFFPPVVINTNKNNNKIL